MCKWYEMNIDPRDVLFFCGAKPMGGSALGEGGNWPLPSVFHQAMLSAFHAKWPELQDWEHAHQQGNEKNMASSCRFGGLKTVGIFPERTNKDAGKTLYFPMPSDVQFLNNDSNELCVLEPRQLVGQGDLPAPLEMGLFKPPQSEATKKKPHRWISLEDLQAYLGGSGIKHDAEMEPLFEVENRPGIGIDRESGTADTGDGNEGGKFYLAEYLRLRDDVSLKALAICEQVRYADEKVPVDVLGNYFESGAEHFVFGGQRGVAQLQGVRDSESADKLLNPTELTGRFVKWVTLTPSIFMGGWLPSWVDAKTGEICRYEKLPRKEGENRKAWRARMKSEGLKKTVIGTLKAAAVNKPVPYSGWRDHGGDGNGGAKPTRLCVPAGAVYYFEVPEKESPNALVAFLNGKCKSDMAAEKGFGFGLCGVWK